MAERRPDPRPEMAERRGAAVVQAIVPVWLIPFGLLSWGWLVAAFGGQDVSSLSWWAAISDALSPWHPRGGTRLVRLALYALLLAAPLALTGTLASTAAPPHLRAHARRALLDWALMAWLLVMIPYGMGLCAGLPPDGISLVVDGEVVGGSATGNRARFGSAVLFGGLLMALPTAIGWRAAIRKAYDGDAPDAITRKRWIYHGVAALIGLAISASAYWAPL